MSWLQDLRYAIRSLARVPRFSLVVVLTFAVGIGATSAVFSALDAMLLRPLSFPDADRLVEMTQHRERSTETNVAPTRLEDWQAANSSFEAITGFYAEGVAETSGDLPEQLQRVTVAPRFFAVFGAAPLVGRVFTAEEHHGRPPSNVLISERLWRNRFNADPAVVGRGLRIGDVAVTIVGVMPASFRIPDRNVDLWRPASVDDPFAQSRNAVWYRAVGRLRPGVSIAQARANLAAVQGDLAARYPTTDADLGIEVSPLKDTLVAGASSSLWLLFGAVLAVLLIACANVATLLLTRAGQRRREIAVRLALGASPPAIVRQVLVETVVLAGVGALLGLAVAALAGRGLRALAADLPRIEEVALNTRVLVFAIATVAVTSVLAGLLPALRSARSAMSEGLAGGRAQVTSAHRAQWLLVGVQVALSVTLLAGAALLVRSAIELDRVDPGFEPSRVLAFNMTATYAESNDFDRVGQRIERTLEALASIPGVDAAATSIITPGVLGSNVLQFATADGRIAADLKAMAKQNVVSAGYFATLGIPLVAGELCRGGTQGEGNLLVNQRFVSTYLPGATSASVAGLELRGVTQFAASGRVVGVVADARDTGLNRPAGPIVYECSTRTLAPVFLVRTRGAPEALAALVRTKLKEIEPLRPVIQLSSLADRIGATFGTERLRTVLLSSFALAALLLAAVGIYGTLSYVASLSRRDVGLRLALGALPGRIVAQFLFGALRVVVIACAVGAALSLVATRSLSGMLYGVSPSDPLTLAIVIAVVLAVATAAAVLPALRAARIEPIRVLREESR